MQKRIVALIIAVLVIAAGILAFVNKGGIDDRPGMVITSGGKEILVAWEEVDSGDFSGELINGKGETSQHDFTGAELNSLLRTNGVEVSADAIITVTSEDNYAAELTGAEVLESGKVYVALTDNGKQIEGIEGGQGGQLIVFGDPNSKRAVKYLKTIEIK
ncbi:MAG: hypothetical protein IJG52_04050 [Lachnospiraceae bacterium]|nr:hypothetical protein [Lachnospiraceae bacterium]